MSNIFNNLIEYAGISSYIPKNIRCSKEITLNTTVKLKSSTRNFSEIIKVSVFTEVIYYKVIKTPIGSSLEGQNLTGKKIIIDGLLNLRIDYLSKDSNKVYCMNYKENFCSTLILNNKFTNKSIFIPTFFVENINAQLVNDNEVFVITSLLSAVET